MAVRTLGLGGIVGLSADTSQLEAFLSALRPAEFMVVIVRALNHTGAKVTTGIRNYIFRNYNIKRGDIIKRVKGYKANYSYLTYRITAPRKYDREFRQGISFHYFGAKGVFIGRGRNRHRGRGVVVAINKGHKRLFKEAFMIPIFGKDIAHAYIRVHPGRGRDAIRPMTGPTLGQILDKPEVFKIAEKIWERNFPNRLAHEMEQYVSGAIKQSLKSLLYTRSH